MKKSQDQSTSREVMYLWNTQGSLYLSLDFSSVRALRQLIASSSLAQKYLQALIYACLTIFVPWPRQQFSIHIHNPSPVFVSSVRLSLDQLGFCRVGLHQNTCVLCWAQTLMRFGVLKLELVIVMHIVKLLCEIYIVHTQYLRLSELLLRNVLYEHFS